MRLGRSMSTSVGLRSGTSVGYAAAAASPAACTAARTLATAPQSHVFRSCWRQQTAANRALRLLDALVPAASGPHRVPRVQGQHCNGLQCWRLRTAASCRQLGSSRNSCAKPLKLCAINNCRSRSVSCTGRFVQHLAERCGRPQRLCNHSCMAPDMARKLSVCFFAVRSPHCSAWQM